MPWKTVYSTGGAMPQVNHHPNERVAVRFFLETVENGRTPGTTWTFYEIDDREYEEGAWREMNERTLRSDVDRLDWPKDKSYDVT